MEQPCTTTRWYHLLLAIQLLLGSLSAVLGSARLQERPLQWSSHGVLLGKEEPIVDPPRRVAGLFKLDRTKDAHLFYFFYESRSKHPHFDPVVLWMTGGPGCSSELAVLYENGPYNLQHNLTLMNNPFGWDVAANMIYVDQPVNTGFSWSADPADAVHGEKQVAKDMLDFLGEFFEAHPELADRDFYITGESYAGHYVPAVAAAVYRARELGTGPDINLAGVAIGNGFTSPAVQYGSYADYALDNGLISQGTRDNIQRWWMPVCTWGGALCNRHKWRWLCSLAYTYCQWAVFYRILAYNPRLNVFDIRKPCEGPLCYDFSAADAFLNSAHVRSALGVGDRRWQLCNSAVESSFDGDVMLDFGHKLVPLLEDGGIRVLIYAGDKDLSCNWLGNRRWLDALHWTGAEGWVTAEERPWFARNGSSSSSSSREGGSSRGRQAGTVTSCGPLSFVKVFESGHLVPMDQPQAALHMIRRFIRHQELAGSVVAGELGGGDDGDPAVAAA